MSELTQDSKPKEKVEARGPDEERVEANDAVEVPGCGAQEGVLEGLYKSTSEFQLDMGKAGLVASDHFDQRTVVGESLGQARGDAEKNFTADASIPMQESIWKAISENLFWTALGLVPGLGPVKEGLERLSKTNGFYAKTAEVVLDKLTADIPKYAASYKPSASPSPASTLPEIITKFLITASEDSSRWLMVGLALYDAWKANSDGDREPWTVDVYKLAVEIMQPTETISDEAHAALILEFEELLWEGLFKQGTVTAGPVSGMLGEVKLGFDGLSLGSLDQACAKFGWAYTDIYSKVPHFEAAAEFAYDEKYTTVDWPAALPLPKLMSHHSANCHGGAGGPQASPSIRASNTHAPAAGGEGAEGPSLIRESPDPRVHTQ